MLRIRKKIGRINPNETKKSYDLHIVIKNYKGKPLFMLMKMRISIMLGLKITIYMCVHYGCVLMTKMMKMLKNYKRL